MQISLVIMAAGLGARFGKLKQIEKVEENGHRILDYSIYDAANAGFNNLVFIIKPEFELAFKSQVHPFASKYFKNIHYVHQTNAEIEKYIKIPEGRIKPFGTAIAALSAKSVVNGPFAVINADDFYGKTAFTTLADFLKKTDISKTPYEFAMVGYELQNTLTAHGTVSRGICKVHGDYLSSVSEYVSLAREGECVVNTSISGLRRFFPLETIVSLNTWAFTPKIFDEIEAGVPVFLDSFKSELEKAEFYLPSVVDSLIKSEKARVKVLKTCERWFGLTYQNDLPALSKALKEMHSVGIYPNDF